MGNNTSAEHILLGGYITTLMISTSGILYIMNKMMNTNMNNTNKNDKDITLLTKIALYLGIEINNNTSYEELKILIDNHIKYNSNQYNKLAEKYD